MSAREIKTKIKSVKNTQKITKAMEMIAASKMRKAQERMQALKPYAHKIREVIAHLAKAHPEYHHPYLKVREIKRVGYIVVGTDRGLCGGLNINLFRKTLSHMQSHHQQGRVMEVCSIGVKSQAYFKMMNVPIVASADHLGDAPTVESLIGVVKVMLDAYVHEKIDALYLVSNEFINTMTQKPQIEQVLPIVPDEEASKPTHWDYIYEPDAKKVLDVLLKRYIESQVYQGVVENIACEQAAKMVAMKNASDNAGEIIKGLNLAYNKARQAAITRELCEIVAGSAAVS